MKKIRGIIFDMDGVVVDNHSYHFEAWMAFAKKYDFELNEDIYREKYNGKTNADLFRMIFGEKISDEEVRKYAEEKEGLYKERYEKHMRPMKGLVEFLDFLLRSKIKIALGTSAPPMNVDFILDGLFLRKYFQVIVDGSMVKKGKPDPEVYQMCCDRLGLRPENCVVFEDALLGIESAQRAGCKAVGVATSHEAYELRAKTDKIIFDFTEARTLLGL